MNERLFGLGEFTCYKIGRHPNSCSSPTLVSGFRSPCPFTELDVPNIDQASIEKIKLFGHCLKRLSVGGSSSLITSIDRSWVSSTADVSITIREPVEVPYDLKRGETSILAGAGTLSFLLNDTWNDNLLSNLLCGSTSFTTLIIGLDRGTTYKFSLPQCLSTKPNFSILSIDGLYAPNLAYLPTLMTTITVINAPSVGETTPYDLSPLASSFPSLATVSITNSKLAGVLPSYTSASSLTLDSNSFSGPIDPDFFLNSPGLNTFSAVNNLLSGTIPSIGLTHLQHLQLGVNQFTHWPPIGASTQSFVSISLFSNPLVQIPDAAFWAAQTALTSLNLEACSGLAGQPLPITNAVQATLLSTYLVRDCGFTGPLPELTPKSADTATTRKWTFSNNQFTATVPLSWSNYTFQTLTLANNPGITGTLPPKMFGPARNEYVSSYNSAITLQELDLSNTALNGPMTFSTNDYFPSYFAPGLIVRAIDSHFDFCSSVVSTVWSMNSFCDLSRTSAYYCQSRYSGASCILSAPVPQAAPQVVPQPVPQAVVPQTIPQAVVPQTAPEMMPEIAPVPQTVPEAEPQAAPEPSPTPQLSPTPVSAPPTTPPSDCNGLPPAPEFLCVGGVWVAPGPVRSPTITVPSNTPIIAQGNVSSPSVVFEGTNASITVQGCIDGLQEISIVLTLEDLQRIEASKDHRLNQSLVILSGDSACSNLTSAALNLQGVTRNGCRRASVQSQTSSNGGLVVIFAMSPTSACKSKTWWIILVSVLCSAVLIAVIVVIALLIFVPSFRARVRPYSTRDRAHPSIK